MNLEDSFLSRVQAASGKPVLVQAEPNFSGHATIRLATAEKPASLILYKPQHESVRPYLVAFQCEFALRTLLADPAHQFDLVAKPNMASDVLGLMKKHLRNRKDFNDSLISQLAGQFGNGLGFQLRSMPITMRIDGHLHANFPELRDMQRESIDRQIQENMHSLSPKAKELAPEEIIRPNASMNAAFARFFSGLWNSPVIFAPFLAAGYGAVAGELLDLQARIPVEPNHDRELVDAWSQHLGLDRWFTTRQR